MSGPNNITIQVDVSGALTSIQGTAEALGLLGERAREAAGELSALRESETTFDTLLSSMSAMIPVMADAKSLMGNLATFSSSLSGLAAPFLGTAAAAQAATAATGALRVVMNALPLVAVATAVATLGAGLYELFTRSQENVGGYKDMEDVLNRLSGVIGGTGESLSTFAQRMDKARDSARGFTLSSLEAAQKAGADDQQAQADAAMGILAKVQQERQAMAGMIGSFTEGAVDVSQLVPQLDPRVVQAFKEFASSGGKDLAALHERLKGFGIAAKDVLETVVEFNGKPMKLADLVAAGEKTRDTMDNVGLKIRFMTDKLTENEQAQLRQTGAMGNAQSAIDAYERAIDPLAQEIAGLNTQIEELRKAADNAPNGTMATEMRKQAEKLVTIVGEKENKLQQLRDQAAAGERAHAQQRTALAKAEEEEEQRKTEAREAEAKARQDAIVTLQEQTKDVQLAAEVARLEAEGTEEARRKIVELTAARKVQSLELQKQRALEGKAGSPEATTIAQSYDDQIRAAGVQGAAELAKITKQQTDAAAKAAQAQAEEVKKQADTIANGWADAMFNQITGKGDSIKNWFKGLFKQIATDALKNKILLPIVTGVLGGAAGLLGGGALGGVAESAAGATGAAGAVPAQGGLEGLLSGLTGALGGLESGIASLGSSLFGTAGTSVFADRVLTTTPATSGLFGSGGAFLGSTDLASGLTGGLGGVGLGMTAAGLLGALGIGKGNTKGGAIGGAIGGAAGSIFFGPLGGTIGGLLGGAIGSLFAGKPSNKEGSAVINLGEDRYDVGGFTGKKFSQENRDAAAGIADKVLSIKDALEKGFGAKITGTLAVGAGDRDGLFATALNSTARTRFSKDEAGMEQLVAYVTGQFVTGIKDQLAPEISAALGRVDFADMDKAVGDLDFIRGFRDSLASLRGDFGLQNQVTEDAKQAVQAQTEAIKDFRETTARLFPEAVGEADQALRAYVEGLVGIREAAPPMTQVEVAMMALEARFQAYKPLLEEVGYTAEQAQAEIAKGLARAKGEAQGQFNDSLDRQYNELTGKGYINQVKDLETSRDAGLRDAAALGLSSEKVDRNFSATLDKQFAELDSTQLAGVLAEFGETGPIADAAQRALDKLNGTVVETADASQIARDRRALEIQIMELEGKTAEALTARRADELAAADASLRPLIERRNQLEDEAKAADLAKDRRALDIQNMELAGDAAGALAAQRADELEAADESLRPLIERRHQLEDEAKAADLAKDKRALEIQNMELAGDAAGALAARREDELKAADESLRPLIERRHQLEDEAKAASLAKDKRALDIQNMELAGDAAGALAAQRADELEAADESLRPLIERRHQLEDEAKAADLAKDRRALEIQIMGLAGDAAGALAAQRADELAAADESLRPLIERRHQLEDEAKATALAKDKRALEIQNMELAGDAVGALAARRADELEATDASLRPLVLRRHALEDEAKAAALAKEARAQEVQILELQGKSTQALALRRKEELDAADASLKPLIAYRHALEDEAAAREAALVLSDRLFAATNDASTLTGALAEFDRKAQREREEAAKRGAVNLAQLEQVLGAERARILEGFHRQEIEAAQAAADQARDTLVETLNREAEAARTLASSWKQAGEGLRDTLKADQLSSQYSSLNPEDQAKLAEDELRRLSALANDGSLTAQERLEAAQALPEARRAFLDAVRPLYEGTERWGEALDMSAALLDGVAQAADREVDLASRQVDLAEGQLQALGIVNDSVLSVAEALKQYREAQDKVDQAKATPVVAPPAAQTPAVPAVPPANVNKPSLTQVRMDLLSNVAMTSKLGDQDVLTWKRPDGSPIGLLRDQVVNGSLEYLTAIAQQIGLSGYQTGGIVGNGLYGVDSVLARYQDGGVIALAGGEFVTRAQSVTAETTPLLRAINDTGRPPATLKDKAALGTKRVEALLEGLLHQSTVADRQQIDLDSRGYEAMIDRLEALLNQGRDMATDRRRTAR